MFGYHAISIQSIFGLTPFGVVAAIYVSLGAMRSQIVYEYL